MLDYRSPSKADYRSHPHHHRFAPQPSSPTSAPAPAAAAHRRAPQQQHPQPSSRSTHSSPMLPTTLAHHFAARAFSLDAAAPASPARAARAAEPGTFQPRVLADVFGGGDAGAGAQDERRPQQDEEQATPSTSAADRMSWLAEATPQQPSFPSSARAKAAATTTTTTDGAAARPPAPPTISTTFLQTPVVGQPLFSPFDPFAPSSSAATAAAEPSLGASASPQPPTPSTAYIEALSHARRGSFLRSLSAGSAASSSSSFSIGEAGPPALLGRDLLGFPSPQHQPDDGRSPSGESVVDYYFGSGADDDDDDGVDDDDGEEMMTESDTTESEARAGLLLSPTRDERSSYAEQLREHTLSVRLSSLALSPTPARPADLRASLPPSSHQMMNSIAPSASAKPSPVKPSSAHAHGHARRTSVASDGSLSGVGMRRAHGARDNVFRNVAVYQAADEPQPL